MTLETGVTKQLSMVLKVLMGLTYVQEDMVQLAKQATSQFNTVNIRVGDVMDMPYDDNTFDVALSFYVTCGLRLECRVYKVHVGIRSYTYV